MQQLFCINQRTKIFVLKSELASYVQPGSSSLPWQKTALKNSMSNKTRVYMVPPLQLSLPAKRADTTCLWMSQDKNQLSPSTKAETIWFPGSQNKNNICPKYAFSESSPCQNLTRPAGAVIVATVDYLLITKITPHLLHKYTQPVDKFFQTS